MDEVPEHYAIDAVAGLIIMFYLFEVIIFQFIPFSLLHLILKRKTKQKSGIAVQIYSISLLFLLTGSAVAYWIEYYSVIAMSFFMDMLFISVYIITETWKSFSVKSRIIQILLLSGVFISASALHSSRYAERIIRLYLYNERFSCRTQWNIDKQYNLYDNLTDKEILPYISSCCIWYYPSIDLARVCNGRNNMSLISVSSREYISITSATEIGTYSEGLFRVKTEECDTFPSKYGGSESLCRTGYIRPDGQWVIRPKYYLAKDFTKGQAKVGTVPAKDPAGFEFLCIDKNDKILKRLKDEEDCGN